MTINPSVRSAFEVAKAETVAAIVETPAETVVAPAPTVRARRITPPKAKAKEVQDVDIQVDETGEVVMLEPTTGVVIDYVVGTITPAECEDVIARGEQDREFVQPPAHIMSRLEQDRVFPQSSAAAAILRLSSDLASAQANLDVAEDEVVSAVAYRDSAAKIVAECIACIRRAC